MLNAGAHARDDRMRNRRPSRLRRVAKWAGLGVCVVIAVCSTVFLQVSFVREFGTSRRLGLLALFAGIVLPVLVAIKVIYILWIRERLSRKGNCPHCGYNLTGNESGVCPECATAVPKQETNA